MRFRHLAVLQIIVSTAVSSARLLYYKPEWWNRFELDSINCNELEARASTEPFIGNDAFWDFANVTFSPGADLETFPGVKIFLYANDIAAFGNFCASISDPFVLITRSNLDEVVPYRHGDEQSQLLSAYTSILGHSALIRWFASNSVLQHPKLTGLPLGPKWQWASTAFHGEDTDKGAMLKVLSHTALDVVSNFYNTKKTATIFSKMAEGSSDGTGYIPWRGSRREAAKHLQLNFPALQATEVSFDEASLASTGACKVRRGSEEYLLQLRQYRFVLSPPGNGPDCHRTWEALLMGCIPIVLSGPLDELYQDLPVLILSSWEDLSPIVLRRAYRSLRYGQHVYAFEKLFTPYWFNVIEKDVQQALQRTH